MRKMAVLSHCVADMQNVILRGELSHFVVCSSSFVEYQLRSVFHFAPAIV